MPSGLVVALVCVVYLIRNKMTYETHLPGLRVLVSWNSCLMWLEESQYNLSPNRLLQGYSWYSGEQDIWPWVCLQIPRKTNHQDLMGEIGIVVLRGIESWNQKLVQGLRQLYLSSSFILSSAIHTAAIQGWLILSLPLSSFPSSAFATFSVWVNSRERIRWD